MTERSRVETGANSVVVDTSRSRFARLRPVAIERVQIADEFWAPGMAINRDITLPAMHRHLEETGRFDNFRWAAGMFAGGYRGKVFNDSDVYKWLEAACWSIASAGPDAGLTGMIDGAIETIAAAQRPDGYLGSYFSHDRANERWTNHDLHEMYCAGHLFQAAIAHHRATGSTRLLEVACRFADHIDATFGPPRDGKRLGADGHPEVEMALVELARETDEPRYRDLAQFFVDVRGHGYLGNAYGVYGTVYHQDHLPFRQMTEIAGHAVRAVYLNAGAADLVLENGERRLREALHALWANMTGRKLAASGGIGSRYDQEAFGPDYEIPNALAYNETCAAIGSAMWSWRMLLAEADARYADLIELQLCNAMRAGASLDGQSFFYENPLEDEGKHRRSAWFEVSCCPPNVARTLASLPGYLYTTSDDGGIWIHLYAAGTASIALADGRVVELRVATRYPWDDAIEIEVGGEGEFALRPRVPGWCDGGAAIDINGRRWEGRATPATYPDVRRVWRKGDLLRITLPMPVRRIETHPFVAGNAGRVAVLRGPLLYCAEAVDHPGVDLRTVHLPDDAPFTVERRPEMLDGVSVLTTTAHSIDPGERWQGRLYRPVGTGETSDQHEVSAIDLTMIPYYAWANREPGRMRVWLPRAPG